MKHIESIEKVTEEIVSNEINYQSLRSKLQEFMNFLTQLTRLELNESIKEANIQFENGIALNTKDAALCVVDIIRTRQFVRGVLKAVNDIKKQKSSTVRIMYAGTGPFAMLILPLLTRYSSDELQLTLLEVNKGTGTHLKRLIEKLEIGAYIEKIVFEDASKYKIEEKAEIDILISETMQFGLVKEQQVPIMLNLVTQLKEDIIIIPQKIKLDLALMNANTELVINNKEELRYKTLKTVLEFDRQFIQTYANEIKQNKQIELCKQLKFKEVADREYDRLVMLTAIQVYGDEWIDVDLSSLTIPKRILNLVDVEKTKKEIAMNYVIKEIPDFEYKLY